MSNNRVETRELRLVAVIVSNAVRDPQRAIGIWALLVVLCLLGMTQLRVEIATESVLDQSGADWRRYVESTETFGSDEDIVVALPAPTFFDDKTISSLRDLSERLAALPGVRRVDSLATTPLVRVSADGDIEYSPPFAEPLSSEQTPIHARACLASESMRGLLVANDGKTFSLRLRLSDPLSLDVQHLSQGIREALGTQEAWVSGVPIFRAETGRYTRREIERFVPLTILVMSILLALFFRSAAAVALSLAIGSTGAIVVLGLMGYLGVPLSLTAAILPSILLAIGCANATHLLAEVPPEHHDELLRDAASDVGGPLSMAAAVTALAFLSGALVPIEAVRVIAVFGALGALVIALATIHLAVAILQLRTISRAHFPEHGFFASVSRRVTHITTTYPRTMLSAWTFALGAVASGILHVSIETDVTQWFPRDGEVRRSYDAISQRLAGISPLNIVIDAGPDGSTTTPEVLRAIDGLTHHLETLPPVGRAISVASVLRDASRGFDGPDRGLPATSPLIEQYLLVLESSEEVREFISSDRRLASVSVRANNNGSETLLSIASEAERWWRANGVAGVSAHSTGIMYEFARAEREITTGQLSGLGLDCVALACLYFLLFRSVSLTAVAVIPTIATVLTTFGLLGWSGSALDAGTVFVGALAVGVTVDETVHLVSAYARAKRSGDHDRDALGVALKRVFPALIMTTTTLAAGFLVLGISSFAFIRQLGLATAIAMAVCALANATLLPSLLSLSDRTAVRTARGLKVDRC
jgi:uncharacterized protein